MITNPQVGDLIVVTEVGTNGLNAGVKEGDRALINRVERGEQGGLLMYLTWFRREIDDPNDAVGWRCEWRGFERIRRAECSTNKK